MNETRAVEEHEEESEVRRLASSIFNESSLRKHSKDDDPFKAS
jgi:hypothetical protein